MPLPSSSSFAGSIYAFTPSLMALVLLHNVGSDEIG